ncbi:LysR substrate-binding domain-containing protein [Variovorax gossypii]
MSVFSTRVKNSTFQGQPQLAALGGHGVALLSLTLSAEELRNGALVQPFGPALDTGSYFLATANGREREPAVRAVWEWIGSQAPGPAEGLA